MFIEKAPTTDDKITMSSLYMEFTGTFALCYFASLSVMQADIGGNIPLGNAFLQMTVLGFMIYAGAKLSGSHYNAAVTLALMVSKHIGVMKGLAYIGAQFLGSLVATFTLLLYKNVYSGPGKFASELGYPHCDTANWNVGACFLMEVVSTMFLVSMVYHTAVNSTKPNDLVYGFCISATLGVSVITIGDITGAALNPWRVIPSAAVTGELWTMNFNRYAWIYYLAIPLTGVMVGLFWKLMFQAKEVAAPLEDQEETVGLNNDLKDKEPKSLPAQPEVSNP